MTRVLVTRQPTSYHGRDDLSDDGGDGTLAARLRAAAALLPPVLGEAPSQPLDLGRTTRVVQPAQRVALAASPHRPHRRQPTAA